MIVYVETNFVLEIAFGQEESGQARRILELAQQNKVQLTLSAFSLIEPYWRIRQQEARRKELRENLQGEQLQVKRCSLNVREDTLLQDAMRVLIELQKKEEDKFETTLKEIIGTCTLLEISKTVFEDSLLYRSKHELEPQDALIYSSVLHDLKTQSAAQPKCFLNRNSKDFDKPGIRDELDEHSCRLIPSFVGGLAYIESEL